MSTDERRSYFRINSEIALNFHAVDAYTVEHDRADEQFPDDVRTLDLFTEFKRLDREAGPLLTTIGEHNRALADYLIILNKKLELLTQQTVSDEYQSKELAPTHLNLSEGGLAFKSSKALYKGSHLAVRLLFLPSYSALACFARVNRCDEDKKGGYKIAVTFHPLDEGKQEMLSKHIMQAQVEARRRSKNHENNTATDRR